jgi:putative transposase
MKNISKEAEEVPLFEGELDRLARAGAAKMLMEAMNAEVVEYLGRLKYERKEEFRGYRNGYAKPRTIAVGLGHLEVRPPRVRKNFEMKAFESRILEKYQRMSDSTRNLLAELYLEGLSSGDFEPLFRHLLGENTPLSSASIVRLKEDWSAEYEAWKKRMLEKRYAYTWGDGVYLKVGPKNDKTAILVVIGVTEDGQKDLLAIEEGYRESKESWSGLLRDLKARGVEEILLFVGDGHLGIWPALNEVFPKAKHQRCWNHRVLNVLDKLPKRMWPEVKKELRNIWKAETEAACRADAEKYAKRLRLMGQTKAAETLLRDFDDFVTFYQFPKEHWVHLRTTNPIESVFAGVRLRTNVAKRMRTQENALYLVFKIIQRLSNNWRSLNAPDLVSFVLAGRTFKDGLLQEEEVRLAA